MVSIICKRLFLSGQYTGSSSVSIVSSLLLLTSSISNSSATVSRQGSGVVQLKPLHQLRWKKLDLYSLKQDPIELNHGSMIMIKSRFSISFSNSLKGSLSSTMAAF